MKFSWSVNPGAANRTKPNQNSIAPNPIEPKKDRTGRARERVSLSRAGSLFGLNTSKRLLRRLFCKLLVYKIDMFSDMHA